MNISWIVANRTVLDPTVDLEHLKKIGSIWGGWQSWRSCQTDNVICHDQSKAQELIQRQFNHNCNFYIPNSSYVLLDRPARVNLYEGDFIHDVDGHEELVAMHLASGSSDIVLLLGFDWSEKPTIMDKLAEHRAHNYRSLVKHAIMDRPTVQWVLVDHLDPVMLSLSNLDNLTTDTMSNVLKMLD